MSSVINTQDTERKISQLDVSCSSEVQETGEERRMRDILNYKRQVKRERYICHRERESREIGMNTLMMLV